MTAITNERQVFFGVLPEEVPVSLGSVVDLVGRVVAHLARSPVDLSGLGAHGLPVVGAEVEPVGYFPAGRSAVRPGVKQKHHMVSFKALGERVRAWDAH